MRATPRQAAEHPSALELHEAFDEDEDPLKSVKVYECSNYAPDLARHSAGSAAAASRDDSDSDSDSCASRWTSNEEGVPAQAVYAAPRPSEHSAPVLAPPSWTGLRSSPPPASSAAEPPSAAARQCASPQLANAPVLPALLPRGAAGTRSWLCAT